MEWRRFIVLEYLGKEWLLHGVYCLCLKFYYLAYFTSYLRLAVWFIASKLKMFHKTKLPCVDQVSRHRFAIIEDQKSKPTSPLAHFCCQSANKLDTLCWFECSENKHNKLSSYMQIFKIFYVWNTECFSLNSQRFYANLFRYSHFNHTQIFTRIDSRIHLKILSLMFVLRMYAQVLNNQPIWRVIYKTT